ARRFSSARGNNRQLRIHGNGVNPGIIEIRCGFFCFIVSFSKEKGTPRLAVQRKKPGISPFETGKPFGFGE
ncbi:MAG: hypothetical protein IKD66_00775, partial [Solobacterium sp.]|nr:hypothetical protein [Solobacterium sp.]